MDIEGSSEIQSDVLDIEVYGRGVRRERGILHLVDDESRCNRAPDSVNPIITVREALLINDSTDAAGLSLCESCDWPATVHTAFEGTTKA